MPTPGADDTNHEEAVVEPIGDDELAAALEAQIAEIAPTPRVSSATKSLTDRIVSSPNSDAQAATYDTLETRSGTSLENELLPESLLFSEPRLPPATSKREPRGDSCESGESFVSGPMSTGLPRGASETFFFDAENNCANTTLAVPAQTESISGPIMPGQNSRQNEGEYVDTDTPHARQFGSESSGTPVSPGELFASRSVRHFWLSCVPSSLVIVIGLGGAFATLGLSVRQIVIAIFLGLIFAAIPTAVGLFTGARSGQSVASISCSAFGPVGGVIRSRAALISRALWLGVLLWAAASAAAAVAVNRGWQVSGAYVQLGSFAAAGIFAVSMAIFGLPVVSRVNGFLMLASVAFAFSTVVLTWGHVNLPPVLGVQEGNWITVFGASIVVFSAMALLWANNVAGRALHGPLNSQLGSSGAIATLSVTLLVLVLTVQGALVGMPDPAVAAELGHDSAITLTHLVPSWFATPLVATIVASFVAVTSVVAYLAGHAVRSMAVRPSRGVMGVIASMGFVVGAGIAFVTCEPNLAPIVRDVATTLAVPLVAWMGIVCAETLLRSRPLDCPLFFRADRRNSAIRWTNVIGLIAVTACGWGFTSSSFMWLNWQGYLSSAVGFGPNDVWTNAQVGVLIALGFSLLVPVVTSIPTARTHERATT